MIDPRPLTLLEELLLLALNEQTGQMHPLNPDALNLAAAGAVLMDLALCNRIDNDLHDMFTVDPTPTGDEILDPVLRTLALAPILMPQPTIQWLRELAEEGAVLQKRAFMRLEKRGIVRRQNTGMFWVFGFGAQMSVDAQKMRDIKSRLMSTIHGSDIPTARSIMLTGLINSCGLFRYLMNETEAKDAEPRIAELARMDLISQATAKGFTETRTAAAGR